MASAFRSPDFAQAEWIVQHDREGRYLAFLTLVHELLCLYGEGHGLPHGAINAANLEDYLDDLKSDLASFTLASGVSEAPASLVSDVDWNRRAALDLFSNARQTTSISGGATTFLRGLVEAYSYVIDRMRRP